MWHTSTCLFTTIRHVLKIRVNQLWTAARALQCSLPYRTQAGVRTDGCCPICPVRHPPTDNTAHILGACSHPKMQELIINRHNKAALMIHAAIMDDSTDPDRGGAFYTILDVCSTSALPPGAHATRIPQWILPAVPDAERALLRPDMLIIHGLTYTDYLQYHPENHPTPQAAAACLAKIQRLYPVRIVELGYTIESLYTDTLTNKRQQHLTLIHHLLAAGWRIDDAPNLPLHPPLPALPPHPLFPTTTGTTLTVAARKTHIIILGSSGSIFNSTPAVLEHLGILPSSLTPLLRRLHIHSVQYVGHIISHRRRLENLPSDFRPNSPIPPDPH